MQEDYGPELRYESAGCGTAMAAYIIDIIGCVTIGCMAIATGWLALISLAWMIPMTVMAYNVYKGMRPNTVAFGVCTLLFVNIISGILLLCTPHSTSVRTSNGTVMTR